MPHPSPEDDAVVEVVSYDPAWPERFAAEERLLGSTLRQWLAGPIEHIGRTAVPGLAAKPVIDIMVPVTSLEESHGSISVVATAGYVYFPYKPHLMHWFCKPSPAVRTHHLHLVPHGSDLWRQRLAFRDALRSDSELAAEYAELKFYLAARFRHDREAYTEAKEPFVRAVLKNAA